MIYGFQAEIGEAWCNNMKVEIADPVVMQEMMTSPQCGGPSLGQAWLAHHKLPTSAAGDDLYIIGLPNGMGDSDSEEHSILRALLFKYLLNEDSIARQSRSDPVISRLLAGLREEVRGREWEKWGKAKSGLPGFVLRYVHYVTFGIDLTPDQFETLWLLYFSPEPGLTKSSFISYLLRYVGTLFQWMGDADMRLLPDRRAAAVELYLKTPAMQGYREKLPAPKFLEAVIVVLGLAGLMGPLVALGNLLSNYKGYIPKDFAWPIGDREALRLCVLEAMRMRPAVFGAALTAPRPFRCCMNGQLATFPTGTPVHLNFVAANRNKEVWGQHANEFSPQEHAGKLWHEGGGSPYPNFNSWGGATHGDRTSGRECPGKDLSLTMMIDLLDTVFAA